MKHNLNEFGTNIGEARASQKPEEKASITQNQALDHNIELPQAGYKPHQDCQEKLEEAAKAESSFGQKKFSFNFASINNSEKNLQTSYDASLEGAITKNAYYSQASLYPRYGLCEKSTQTLLTMREIEDYEALKVIPQQEFYANLFQASPDLIPKIFGRYYLQDNLIFGHDDRINLADNPRNLALNAQESFYRQKANNTSRQINGLLLQSDALFQGNCNSNEDKIISRKRKNPINYNDFNKNGIIEESSNLDFKKKSKGLLGNLNLNVSKPNNIENSSFSEISFIRNENFKSGNFNNKINIKRRLDNRKKGKLKELSAKTKLQLTRIPGLEKPSAGRVGKPKKIIDAASVQNGSNYNNNSNKTEKKNNLLNLNLTESKSNPSLENAKTTETPASSLLSIQKNSSKKTASFSIKKSKRFENEEKILSSVNEDFSKSSLDKKEAVSYIEPIDEDIIMSNKDPQEIDSNFFENNKSNLPTDNRKNLNFYPFNIRHDNVSIIVNLIKVQLLTGKKLFFVF